MNEAYEKAAEAAAWLSARVAAPRVGAVLGSGLGALADQLEEVERVPFGAIPHFLGTAVAGHAGALVVGRLPGQSARVAVFAGRVHLYEGHPIWQVVHGVRTLRLWGGQALLLTNAAGGIAPDMAPGDLMRITDHLNMTGTNPLRGHHEPRFGERFPDMGAAYDAEFGAIFDGLAAEAGVRLHRGVYAGLNGPSYETPAEIRMLRTLGASAVGMSTVCEVIAAHHCGLRVAGISCVTNLAAGLADERLRHEDVQAIAEQARAGFLRLVVRGLAEMDGRLAGSPGGSAGAAPGQGARS